MNGSQWLISFSGTSSIEESNSPEHQLSSPREAGDSTLVNKSKPECLSAPDD